MMRWVRSKRFLLVGALVLLVLVALFVRHAVRHHEVPHRDLPVVKVVKVKLAQAVKSLSAIGTVKAAQGIHLSALNSGIVSEVYFHSGKAVKSGDVLLVLNNHALKATVAQDLLKYKLAKVKADRYKKLFTKGYVSHEDNDQNISDMRQAKSQLEHDQALLDNTVIKAPFSGVLGIRQVDVGEYISAGHAIVTLQNRNKLYVDFSISEKQADLLSLGNRIVAQSNQARAHHWRGKITALDAMLDDKVRSLPVRAEIFPPYQNLVPGMYVTVSVLLPSNQKKPLIPQSAIVYNPYGNFVYVYQKGKVTQQYVTLGRRIKQDILVEKGLQAGQRIVTEGQQKLYNGASVKLSVEG